MQTKSSFRLLCTFIGLCSVLSTSCDETVVSIEDDTPACKNACKSESFRCYDERQIEICIVKSNGCTSWSDPQLCPSSSVCIDNTCQSCPDTSCEPNQRSCDAKGARVCGDFDGNGCFEWSQYTPCPSGCNGDVCNGCTNQCEPNQRSCDAKGARVCGDFDGNGCFEWSNYTPCPSGCDGDVCRECQNACTNGKKSCDAQGARICGDFDGNGCFEWSNYTPCPSGCDGNVCKAAPSYEPTRYPGNAILSPITPYVVDKMKAIRNKNKSRNDNSFMKLGDSHMYEGSSFMYCFSNKSPKHTGYDLAGIPVTDAVSAFQSSFDAFARVSVTTVLGKTANLPIANGNSLLNQEISATNPRFAFYGFGTNDMGWFDYRKFKTNNQGGYFYAMQLYYRNVLAAIDALIAAGIIPIVIGTGWRNEKAKYYGTQTQVADKDLPKHFVTSFNAVSRGIAEFYQIPYYNLQLSHDKIENFGLSTDGIHHKTIHNGCDFTTNGLTAGANRRNRYAIEQLQNAWRTTVKSSPAPATQTHPFQGNGSHANPYIIPDLPYTHMASTANAETKFDTYSCNTSVKEFGPEKLYKLTVSKQTRIRAFAMSASGVDVDIHLLSAPNANACLARGDKWIEAKLSAGTYYFAIDTYNENRTNSNAGTYLFGIHTCDPDDADCGSRNIGE